MFRHRRTRAHPWYTHYEGMRADEYVAGEEELAESFEMSEGRQRYWRQVEELRFRLGLSHQEARQRWSDYYERGGKPKRAIKKLSLSVKASTSSDQTVCPFCRDSIYHPDDGGGEDYICECKAHYHLDCFEEELGGRCATLGCSTRRVISRAQTQLRIRARGRVTTEATRVTRAHDRGAEVQELDPVAYRAEQARRSLQDGAERLVQADRDQESHEQENSSVGRQRARQSSLIEMILDWMSNPIISAMVFGLLILIVLFVSLLKS